MLSQQVELISDHINERTANLGADFVDGCRV